MSRSAIGRYHPSASLLALVAVLGAWIALAGNTRSGPQVQPAKRSPAAAKKPSYTATYDVSDLVQKQPGGIEEIVLLIVRSDPPSWRDPSATGYRISEVNGTKLEIYTDATHHGEVQDLLAALRRAADVAVIVESELYEVDRAWYQKEIEPRLTDQPPGLGHRLASPLGERENGLVRKQGTRLRTHKVTLLPGREALIFSVKRALGYRTQQGILPPRDEGYAVAFAGFSFRGRAEVSADRRFVRLTATQDATNLLGFKKQTIFDDRGNESQVEVPDLATTSTTATVRVGDGGDILFPVHFQTARDKGRVTLLLVRPVIYIEEEESIRKKQGR
jgi:hypothetical protein